MTAWGTFWNHHWFRPADPLGVVAVRVLAGGNALWLVLSRPDLPGVLAWPREVLTSDASLSSLRFFVLLLPVTVERFLYVLLHGALVATILGIHPRLLSGLSAVLLYHFAPFEHLMASGQLWFQGLTLPLLMLFVVAFAAPARPGMPPSWEYRWPLASAQFLLATQYFLAGTAKLVQVGPVWLSGDNFAQLLLIQASRQTIVTPWALTLAGSPIACWSVAIGTVVLELLWPLALVSRRAALLFVPVSIIGHVGIIGTFGLVFLNLPLLPLFLDWDAIARRLARLAPRLAPE